MIKDLDEDLANTLLPMFMRPGMYIGEAQDTLENREKLIQFACVNAANFKMMRKFSHISEDNETYAYGTDEEGFPLKGEFPEEHIQWARQERDRLEKAVFSNDLWKHFLWGKKTTISNEKH